MYQGMKSILIVLVLTIFSVSITARFTYIVGECPGGVEPGSEWFEQTPCRRCRCVENAYECDDCENDTPLFLQDNCYLVKKKADNSAKYPKCCQTHTSICKGDSNFDQIAFETFIGTLQL
ncbi:uncharacterized protein LOC121375837 [Gigantopelta aegis]|uniref:uncharacterized protein LOC121375837 n=1 Tax=Gigantopelta aegis TaxID=1735272 RepID=UPI001B887B51|nr:uncharacterized protein LOC121375837 [Gigantopelta aegis]